jgi:hypothetical protein
LSNLSLKCQTFCPPYVGPSSLNQIDIKSGEDFNFISQY